MDVDGDGALDVVQYALYYGAELLPCNGWSCNKVYLNLSIDLEDLPPGCVLDAEATAVGSGETTIAGGGIVASGATYGFVVYEAVPLDVLAAHPLDGPGSKVLTRYGTSPDMLGGRTPAILCTAYDGGEAPYAITLDARYVDELGRSECAPRPCVFHEDCGVGVRCELGACVPDVAPGEGEVGDGCGGSGECTSGACVAGACAAACDANADCAVDEVCMESDDGLTRGCAPASACNDACTAPEASCSRYETSQGYCATWCERDADCESGRCAADFEPVPDGGGPDRFYRTCAPALPSGPSLPGELELDWFADGYHQSSYCTTGDGCWDDTDCDTDGGWNCTIPGDGTGVGVCAYEGPTPGSCWWGDCNGVCDAGDFPRTEDCDGMCTADEAGSVDCDGVCVVGEEGSDDCDGTCDPQDQAPGPDCNFDGVCWYDEAPSHPDCQGAAPPHEDGFFDGATVTFGDITCAAHVDTCIDGATVSALPHPSGGDPGRIAVFMFACTSDTVAAEDIVMYMDDVTIQCGKSRVVLDSAMGDGGLVYGQDTNDPSTTDGVFQYAVYEGRKTMGCGAAPCDASYWYVAAALDDPNPRTNCFLRTKAAAADQTLAGAFTPAGAYPYVDLDLPLNTSASPGIQCHDLALGEGDALEALQTAPTTPVRFLEELTFDGASVDTHDSDALIASGGSSGGGGGSQGHFSSHFETAFNRPFDGSIFVTARCNGQAAGQTLYYSQTIERRTLGQSAVSFEIWGGNGLFPIPPEPSLTCGHDFVIVEDGTTGAAYTSGGGGSYVPGNEASGNGGVIVQVFRDLDGNGMFDGVDIAYQGFTTAVSGGTPATSATNGFGYQFHFNVSPGTRTVTVTPPSGVTPGASTPPLPLIIEVQPGRTNVVRIRYP